MIKSREQLEQEIEELKGKVRAGMARNPWPWLVGGLVIGFAAGAVFV